MKTNTCSSFLCRNVAKPYRPDWLTAVSLVRVAVAQKEGVSKLDEGIVHSKAVHRLHPMRLHVV